METTIDIRDRRADPRAGDPRAGDPRADDPPARYSRPALREAIDGAPGTR